MNEIRLHRQLKQSNIVQFQHFFDTEEHIYILMEICPNQTI